MSFDAFIKLFQNFKYIIVNKSGNNSKKFEDCHCAIDRRYIKSIAIVIPCVIVSSLLNENSLLMMILFNIHSHVIESKIIDVVIVVLNVEYFAYNYANFPYASSSERERERHILSYNFIKTSNNML